MTEEIRVVFYNGYGNKPKACVWVGKDEASGHTIAEIEAKGLKSPKEYVLDLDYLAELLEKQITERGYRIEQSKRQKYPRLYINE